MAPFSVDDRKRPGPDRRSTEISKIAADALRPALMLESFPRSMVDVSIEVIEAEGGARLKHVSVDGLEGPPDIVVPLVGGGGGNACH